MARAKKLPSGSWRVRASVGKRDGKYVYKSFTAPTKKEAEYLATSYLMDHKEADAQSSTIKEAMERYIETHRAVSSLSTVRSWRQLQRCYYGDIEAVRICSLMYSDIKDNIIHVQRVVVEAADERLPEKHIALTAVSCHNSCHIFF